MLTISSSVVIIKYYAGRRAYLNHQPNDTVHKIPQCILTCVRVEYTLNGQTAYGF